ncbi:MAG TPA: alpha/beta hydrolase [Polyangiaceae bacterium]|nr:alpha/beta hydrolase [Polyangiaceae bacterium]
MQESRYESTLPATRFPVRGGGGPAWARATREDEPVTAEDGYALAASWYYPEGAARGAVLIASAMGVPKSHYDPFARWLAARGFLTVTFDYRGTGGSISGKLRDLEADVMTWARDSGAVLSALEKRGSDVPLTWIGHSIGGQFLPFVPGHERLHRMVTIATGTGYWRDNSPATRRRAAFLWHVAAPVLVSAFGYFPGKRFRLVGDLPRGVMNQWRRWCLHPEYLVGVEGEEARRRYASCTVPVTSISFTDDEMMSARSIEVMHGFYPSCEMLRIAPADVGLSRIGHFGFFRRGMEDALWKLLFSA